MVIRLFLPMDVALEDDYVRNLVERMDVNKDGKIAFAEFVRFIKETGSADILKFGTAV